MFHYFVNVPAGTPAFKVDLDDHSAAGAGQVRFLRFHPYGVNFDPNSSLDCYSPPCAGSTCNPLSRTASQPQPGVWEVTVEARRTSDTDAAPFTLTMSILGATVDAESRHHRRRRRSEFRSPAATRRPTCSVPSPDAMVGTTLGSAMRWRRPTIADLAQQQYRSTVTAGTTSASGRRSAARPIRPPTSTCSCSTARPARCVLAGQSADGDSEESVTIANPAAGLWVVLVDGFAVPAGTTTYNYVDVFVNPAFGSVSVTDANALRPAGSAWTVPASVTANAAPGSRPRAARQRAGADRHQRPHRLG